MRFFNSSFYKHRGKLILNGYPATHIFALGRGQNPWVKSVSNVRGLSESSKNSVSQRKISQCCVTVLILVVKNPMNPISPKFIEKHSVLNNSQYGFRNEHSTSLAIIELIEEITCANDNKKSTIGVFIDLKKAFDTVNHSILIKKMEHYGIRGIASEWLHSYITNRQQYVSYNETDSNLLNIVCGVPQGSILGPILFILYINDLCSVSEVLKFVLFADDTNLFVSGSNIQGVT